MISGADVVVLGSSSSSFKSLSSCDTMESSNNNNQLEEDHRENQKQSHHHVTEPQDDQHTSNDEQPPPIISLLKQLSIGSNSECPPSVKKPSSVPPGYERKTEPESRVWWDDETATTTNNASSGTAVLKPTDLNSSILIPPESSSGSCSMMLYGNNTNEFVKSHQKVQRCTSAPPIATKSGFYNFDQNHTTSSNNTNALGDSTLAVVPTQTEEFYYSTYAPDSSNPRLPIPYNAYEQLVDSKISEDHNQKSLMDRIQEDFPRTPSPVYGTTTTSESATTTDPSTTANSSNNNSYANIAQPRPMNNTACHINDDHSNDEKQYYTAAASPYYHPPSQRQVGYHAPSNSLHHHPPPHPHDDSNMMMYRNNNPHNIRRKGNNMYNNNAKQMPMPPYHHPSMMHYDHPHNIMPPQLPSNATPYYQQQQHQHHNVPPPPPHPPHYYGGQQGHNFNNTNTTGGPSRVMINFRNEMNNAVLYNSQYHLQQQTYPHPMPFTLQDIIGNAVEFARDQHGSRFIQQQLELHHHQQQHTNSIIFKELLPFVFSLMTDVFGNYVIQKYFDVGTSDQISILGNKIRGHVLELSCQMYGCRVIQKALEAFLPHCKTLALELISELRGNVTRCVQDQNGNHVIQKCIEIVDWTNNTIGGDNQIITKDDIDFILTSFTGNIKLLATHPYGCRVIQRLLEYCDEVSMTRVLKEVEDAALELVRDSYGNYVVQHVLEKGSRRQKHRMVALLTPHTVALSQHKFASNVIEKCLLYSTADQRRNIIATVLSEIPVSSYNNTTTTTTGLQIMMKDQYANYVIQKLIEVADDQERQVMVCRIQPQVQMLKRFTYGKHIVARLEKLTGNRIF